ncbi:TrbC/VirB2 family protein [Variovorax fucosicus]|uniref:TrbC/VirB2 family protein n=1 Tax=Variovorax fucosicus TaxID=3053517 RepID=UPI002578D4CE|nr:TrbC/VirB2 family protein [Variovorax sp. J22G47]MDM0058976.1 TrbC/VirB2 family protein [Variovorax sp. J22G47]
MDADGRAWAEEFSEPGNVGPAPQDDGRGAHHHPARAPDLASDRAAPSPSPSRWLQWLAALALAVPGVALAGSPFATGANATQTQLVAILTPLAAVAVMVSGVMAWFGRISWWWMVGVVLGTVLVFGGPQIVSWIRGMFGV